MLGASACAVGAGELDSLGASRRDQIMSEEIRIPDDIVAFAEGLTEGDPGALEVIKIHEFADDGEAHDDEFQARMHREFDAVHSSLVEKLSKKFGAPRIAEEEDEFDGIPLCGVFPAAIWDVSDGELFLAVSHEDRETPILLAIGTV